MARLNDQLDSDDELPELSKILGLPTEAIIRSLPKTLKQEPGEIPFPRTETQKLTTKDLATENHLIAPETLIEVSSDKHRSRKQRPLRHLKQAYVNSLLLPMSDASIQTNKSDDNQSIEAVDSVSNAASPRKLVQGAADCSRLAQMSANAMDLAHHDDYSYTDLSEFIVPDSASDGETRKSRLPKKKKEKKSRSLTNSTAHSQEPRSQVSRQSLIRIRISSGTTDLILPEEKNKFQICLKSSPSNELYRSELVDAYPDLGERLTFSPSRFSSPGEAEDKYHSLTPPSSPLISKLKSPSKRHRIPPSTGGPSVDAFWSQDVINDWNEQYPPGKTIKSPPKFRIHSVEEDKELSPSGSPRKSPIKSPGKKDRKIIEQRKLFDSRKHKLAAAFLAEVDQTITDGQIASMADSTGGIKIVWSKKLSSTAGRANWKRDVLCSKNADGSVSKTTHRHHASIELAEKVIDDEDRLINVIAHEYCHLANFMISGIKDNPHGKDFKEWARKCTNAFAHRAVKVTTKHAYTIAYKYIWTCLSPTCGLEYKRHSKSIDPTKHSCGNCKGKLEQVQPVPRKGALEGKRSEYQQFVKRENERVRLENPGAGFGEIMSIIGRDFKECKKKEAESVNGVEEHSALEGTKSNESGSLDTAVRKLDFLTLGS